MRSSALSRMFRGQRWSNSSRAFSFSSSARRAAVFGVVATTSSFALTHLAEESVSSVQETQVDVDVVHAELSHRESSMIFLRFEARWLDCVWIGFAVVISTLLGGRVFGMLVGAVLEICKDLIWGRSPGKRFVGLWPIDIETGKKASPQQLIVRNLLGPFSVSLAELFGPTGVLLAVTAALWNDLHIFFNPQLQTWMDSQIGSVVVKGTSVERSPFFESVESLTKRFV